MTANERLLVLEEDWRGCTRCRLHKKRLGDQIVFGMGRAPADYLLIGPRPTEEDEKECLPFCGDEGDLLTELLETAGIDPEDCYLTHMVGCRPKVFLPATDEEDERVETVLPQKEDFSGVYDKYEKIWHEEGCFRRVHTQIYEVDPRIIITFGEVPLAFLKARDNNGKRPRVMAEAQVELFEISIPGKVMESVRYPVMAALDMSYLIKNPVTAEHGPIAIVLEALRRARAYVEWVKAQEGARA